MQTVLVPVATVLAAFLGSFAASFLASHPSPASTSGKWARRLGAEKSYLPDPIKEELDALKVSQTLLKEELKELQQQMAGAAQGPRYIAWPELAAPHNETVSENDRRLSGLFKAATTMAAGVACFGYTTAVTSVDLNSATACSSTICPDCFYWDLSTPADVSVTFSNCQTSKWGSYTMGTAPLGTAIRSYTFINMMASNRVTISDGTTTYVLPGGTSMTAFCKTGAATLYYPWNPSQDKGCPKGCDDTTPNLPSGSSFSNAVNFPGACSTADGGTTSMADVCLLGR